MIIARSDHGRARVRRAGLTLVEVAVATALLAGIFLALGLSLDSAFDAQEMAEAEAELDQQAHRALGQIVRELADAGAASLGAPTGAFGSTTLAFRRPAAYDSGTDVTTWSTETRIGWRREAGELDDGADNDGDGLVDEGEVFWTYDFDQATERTVTKVRGVPELAEGEDANLLDDNGNGIVDEAGLDFEWDGAVLTVRLTLARVGPNGEPMLRSVQTATRLRN